MSWVNDEHAEKICPKTGRRIEREREHRWASWMLPFVEVASLLWFLIRVIPKPSRAAYPCQRAAFPLASAFVVWLTGIIVSSLAYRKARRLAGRARYVAAGLFAAVAVAAIWGSISITADTGARAAFVPIDPPNSPMGVGKGIYPGRVVWVHDPNKPAGAGETEAVWVGGDYHVKAGSACIDAGNPVAITWMDVEIDDMWRAVGSAPDIGAYEFGMLR